MIDFQGIERHLTTEKKTHSTREEYGQLRVQPLSCYLFIILQTVPLCKYRLSQVVV